MHMSKHVFHSYRTGLLDSKQPYLHPKQSINMYFIHTKRPTPHLLDHREGGSSANALQVREAEGVIRPLVPRVDRCHILLSK